MFQRGLGKRGQEGVTLTTLILIVIGVIVAVVIIVGATGGLDFIFGKFNQAPLQDLETNVQRCKIDLDSNLVADYCLEFKQIKVSGDVEIINCDDSRIKASLRQATGSDPTISCQTTYSDTYLRAQQTACSKLSVSQQDNVKVNGGMTCKDIIGTGPNP